MTMNDPKAPTRSELAEVLKSPRMVRAFEELFRIVPGEFNELNDRVSALENPAVLSVSTSVQLSTAAYGILVTATGKTITLPKAASSIIGRIWTITLGVAGTCTIATDVGDSFPVPSSATETSLIMTQRGETYDFRCMSTTTWAIV